MITPLIFILATHHRVTPLYVFYQFLPGNGGSAEANFSLALLTFFVRPQRLSSSDRLPVFTQHDDRIM